MVLTRSITERLVNISICTAGKTITTNQITLMQKRNKASKTVIIGLTREIYITQHDNICVYLSLVHIQ